MKPILALVALLFATGSALAAPAYQEPPFFADAVKKGDLPPIGERLPRARRSPSSNGPAKCRGNTAAS